MKTTVSHIFALQRAGSIWRLLGWCAMWLMAMALWGCQVNTVTDMVPYDILVVHESDELAESNKIFDKEVRAAFAEAGMAVRISNCYTGNCRYGDTAKVSQLIRDEIANCNVEHLDLIMARGDVNALSVRNLSVPYPVVFGGVMPRLEPYVRATDNICGCTSAIDYVRNVQLAKEISGYDKVEVELDEFFLDSLQRMDMDMQLAVGHCLTDVIVRSVRSMDKTHLLRCIKKSRWNAHLNVKHDVYAGTFMNNAPECQFTAIHSRFLSSSHKLLCGYFVTAQTEARDMAMLCAQILEHNIRPSVIPTVKSRPTYNMDWLAMERSGLQYGDYSDRFVIYGAPLLVMYPYHFAFVVLLVILLMVWLALRVAGLMSKWRMGVNMTKIEDLQKNKSMQDMALQGADATIWERKGNTIYLDDEFCRRHHLPIQGLSKEALVDLIHPDQRSVVRRNSMDRTRPGSYVSTFLMSTDDGVTYQNWRLKYRILKGGEYEEGVLFNCDKMVEHEQMTRSTQETLDNEVGSKEMFLRNLSHEIRTPLNSILGFSTLLTAPQGEYSDEDQDVFCKFISQNAEYLLNIVNDILDLSRIKSGRMNYTYEDINVSEFLMDIYNKWMARKPDYLEFSIDAMRRDIVIRADRKRLTQVLDQVISNAFKFTPSDARLAQVFIGAHLFFGAKSVSIFVEDTGVGIEDGKKDNVFDLLYKDNTDNRGSSLGLAITRALTIDMNGNIDFDSCAGVGSHFVITFPCVNLFATAGQ